MKFNLLILEREEMGELTAKALLGADQVSGRIASFEAWSLAADELAIERRLLFTDFVQAFEFMGEVAGEAEALNHHPEWSNVWNRVDIRLTTHSAGGLTDKDFELASAIDRIASRYALVCGLDGEGCGGCA